MNTNRKGQLSALPNSLIIVVVAIIILVLGLVVLQELRDTDTLTKVNSGSVTNETVTSVNHAGDALSVSGSPACAATMTVVVNASSNTLIRAGNYSVNGCVLYAADVYAGFNGTTWNVTYTYTYGDEAYSAGNNSLVGLGSFADFIPIIIIAMAASIIIGLILLGFAFGRRQR